VPFTGEFNLEYNTKEEERQFKQTRRLGGFHISVVKNLFTSEAWAILLGPAWEKPEPLGRGQAGQWGMALRYACLDHWFRDEAIERGRFTKDEVDNWWKTWKHTLDRDKIKELDLHVPMTHADLLRYWRTHRKEKIASTAANIRKRERRRTKSWELQFQAERDPAMVYRRLKSTIAVASPVDEMLLRSFSRQLADANDLLWQAEQFKDVDGAVAIESLPDYSKLIDLVSKAQKQITDLLHAHGYDYQARRQRREAQTAAEVFDEFVAQAAVLFDERAIEMVCSDCKLSLGYFVRHFPTIGYEIGTRCPRCQKQTSFALEALPDEVMSVES